MRNIMPKLEAIVQNIHPFEEDFTSVTKVKDVLDDLELIEFIVAVEEAFDIYIDDEDADKWRTMGDIEEYLANAGTGAPSFGSSSGYCAFADAGSNLASSFDDVIDTMHSLPRRGRGLSAAASDIRRRRGQGWHYLLFMQVWKDVVDDKARLLHLFDESPFSPGIGALSHSPLVWLGAQLSEFLYLFREFQQIVRQRFQDALRLPTARAQEDAIIRSAEQLGYILVLAIMWQSRCRRVELDSPFSSLTEPLAHMADDMMEKLNTFPGASLPVLYTALERPAVGPELTPMNLQITLEIRPIGDFLLKYVMIVRAYADMAAS